MHLPNRPEPAPGERALRRLPSLLETAAVLSGLYFLGAVAWVVLHRIGYPFELEWMEGGSLVQVARIVSGRPLYAAPSLEFVPYIYPPLYYYASAISASCFGVTFLSLRLVSAFAALGCFASIYRFVRRLGGSATAGILGVSLFAATFRLSGAWFDVGRVDMLALFFLLAGGVLVIPDSTGSRIAGGVLFAAAIFTKQTNLLVVAPILLVVLSTRARSALTALLATLAASAAALVILTALYGRWFLYYVYTLPSRHDLTMRGGAFCDAASFVLREIMAPLPVAALFAVALMVTGGPAMRAQGRTAFPGVLVAAAFLSSWLGTVNPGGYSNALLPLHAALAIAFGLAFDALRARSARGSSPGSIAFFRSMTAVGVIVQFGLLLYPVDAQIPTARDLARNRELRALVRTIPGEVFMPFHPEFPMLVGKRSWANAAALHEVVTWFGGARAASEGRSVEADLRQAVRERRFGAVILDTDSMAPEIRSGYPKCLPAFDGDDGGWPVTGWRTRPKYLFLP